MSRQEAFYWIAGYFTCLISTSVLIAFGGTGAFIFDFFRESLPHFFSRMSCRFNKSNMQLRKQEEPLIKKFVDNCVSEIFVNGNEDVNVLIGKFCDVFGCEVSKFTAKQIDTLNYFLKEAVNRFVRVREEPNRIFKHRILDIALELVEACQKLYWFFRLYTMYKRGNHSLHYLVNSFDLTFKKAFIPFFLDDLGLPPNIIGDIYSYNYYWDNRGYQCDVDIIHLTAPLT